jgi:hypothetical protein
MISAFKRVFRRITPAEVAAKELACAELEMLEAQTAREFADSVISYNDCRIKRLRKFLAGLERAS